MKKLFSILAFLCLALPALAQNWTTVSASNITDLNQNKLAAGQLCFLITDQNDNPISVNIGGGGQSLKRGYCSPVAAGAVTSFTVPNPATTSPSGIYYRVTAKDTSTGLEVLRYTGVTFSGASFNFDNYQPVIQGASLNPLSGNSVMGNLSVSGNLSVTGSFNPGSVTTGALSASTGTFSGAVTDQAGLAVGTGSTISTSGDICANMVASMAASPNGGHWLLPAGTFTCSQSSYTIPNNGVTPPQQASFKFTGTGADAGAANSPTLGKVPTSGTILNMNGSASAGKFLALGEGQIEFSGITFKDTNTDCSPFFFVSNTVPKIHDNYFYGSTFAWISNLATRVQTTGGTTALKYSLDLGVSGNGTSYRYSINIKNQGSTAVTVGGSLAGSTITVQPGTIGQLGVLVVGDGVTHLKFNLSTVNSGDSMDVIVQNPWILPPNQVNLVSPNDNFLFKNSGSGTWAVQGGATPTITQSQSVSQAACNDAIVLGGTTTSRDGTTNGSFTGYGGVIRDNFFDNVKRAVLLQTFANAIVIDNNTIWVNSGNANGGAIEVTQGAQGNYIDHNTIETFAYKYGVYVPSGFNNFIDANTCFDQNDIFVACERVDAGSTGNVVIDTGVASSGISEGTTRQNTGLTNNGIQLPGGSTATPSVMWAGAPPTGFYASGGGIVVSNASADQIAFDWENSSQIKLRGDVGAFTFASSSTITAINADTGISRGGAAKTVAIGNGSPGDASGTLKTNVVALGGTVQNSGGTSTMGMTLKKGSAGGNYTTTSTSYVQVDGTNLASTVTIPTGWKLGISASGSVSCSTALATSGVAIADGGTTLVEAVQACSGVGLFGAFALNWVVTGDGASHSVDLRFKTFTGADAANIANNTSTQIPSMVLTLMPSN
jgi:hypothetical protein